MGIRRIGLKLLIISIGALMSLQTAHARIVSQLSIDEGDYTFIRVLPVMAEFDSVEAVTFQICNEEILNCETFGKGIYPVSELQVILHPDIVQGRGILLKDIKIDVFTDMLKAILDSIDRRLGR